MPKMPISSNGPKETPQKKRGRKPKGGKLVDAKDLPKKTKTLLKPNIILHLQCFLSDLDKTYVSENMVEAYNEPCQSLTFSSIHQGEEKEYTVQQNTAPETIEPSPDTTKQLVQRLHELDKYLRHIQKNSDDVNNVVAHETIEKMEHHSACFWCTCEFQTPSIYLPKHEVNGRYEVYGCFCTPECASAYLFEERIDQSVKWERYALLNYLYKNIYEQSKPFHPAPEPRYVLNKYFGTLSIEEYRALLRTGKHMMVIDKPITKVYPEVHVDNHEFEELSGIRGKRKIRLTAPKHVKQEKQKSKTHIMNNIFGVS